MIISLFVILLTWRAIKLRLGRLPFSAKLVEGLELCQGKPPFPLGWAKVVFTGQTSLASTLPGSQSAAPATKSALVVVVDGHGSGGADGSEVVMIILMVVMIMLMVVMIVVVMVVVKRDGGDGGGDDNIDGGDGDVGYGDGGDGLRDPDM